MTGRAAPSCLPRAVWEGHEGARLRAAGWPLLLQLLHRGQASPCSTWHGYNYILHVHPSNARCNTYSNAVRHNLPATARCALPYSHLMYAKVDTVMKPK